MALTLEHGNTAVREQRLDELGPFLRPLGALASKQKEHRDRMRRERLRVGVVALLRPQLPRNRVRSCDTSWPDRRGPKLLQGIRVEASFCQEDAEELLALIFGKKRIEPSQELRSLPG